jgi:thiol:disulfide interchange protein
VRRFIIVLLACLDLGLTTARAAHTQVSLLLSADTARPGDTVLVGVDLKMDPGWHTYWKNPGESGIATTIKWHLPPGVTAGDIQWPLPHKLPPAEVTTYGYLDEVMLVVPLTLSADLKPGQSLNLSADVSWLECKEQCIPGKDTVSTTLTVGNDTKPSAAADSIAAWQKQVPGSVTNSPWSLHAYWEKPATNDTRTLIIAGQFNGEQNRPLTIQSADLFPDPNDNYEIQPAADLLPAQFDLFSLRKSVQKFSGDWPATISGVLILGTSYGPTNFAVQLSVANQKMNRATPVASPTAPTTHSRAATPPAPTQPLALMMLYAFIGGLILNIMPCVLPVIALKILGFVGEARSQPRRVRLLGLVYGLGVLVSFMILAGVVIGIKAAGHQAGWGIQFGNPIFVVTLTTLVMLVALNLFGLFEVTLSGRALDSASQLTLQHGFSGAFFNGVLATALATPCTAPFLGYALGFAFAQNAAVILTIFLMVGLGLAAPYIALSWNPAWLKYLPKPGVWMEKFKIAMGFPMLLTMVWLFNLAYGNYGSHVLWLGIFLVMVAFAAWIFGEFVQRGRRHPGVALGITAALLIGGYAYALEDQLHWREMAKATDATVSLREGADGIDWQKWTPEAVAAAQAAGHPVLVDFTADWCLTCQVNKKTSLEIPATRAKLKAANAVALVADYTHAPDNITAELTRHGRAGVPLVLVYPKIAGAPPIILPEVLTPGIVMNALDQASH